MATQKVVVDGTSVTARQMKEFWDLHANGARTGVHLQAYIEGRNPFDETRVASCVFPLSTGDGRNGKALLAAGSFDYVGDYARKFAEGKQFPISADKVEFDIEYVEFDFDPTSEQVLAKFEQLGLVRPQAEDALRFGGKYPDEQKKGGPIVFLHEPWLGPDGNRRVLYLDRYGAERYLSADRFGYQWRRVCRFAGRRLRK